MFKKLSLNVLLLIGSVIVSICVAEAGLWLLHIPPFPDRINDNLMPDPEAGFVFRPNSVSKHSSWEFDTAIRINNIGARVDYDVSPQTRIFAFLLGDSFAQSCGVNSKDMLSSRIESTLRSGPVLNLGVGSYSTYQELVIYKRQIEYFSAKPKFAILVFYAGNDYSDNVRYLRHFEKNGQQLQTASNGYLVEPGVTIKRTAKDLIRISGGREMERKPISAFYPPKGKESRFWGWSKLYNIWAWLGYSPPKDCRLPIGIPGLFDRKYNLADSVAWEDTEKALADFVRTSRANHIIPVIVVMPSKYQLMPELLSAAGCDLSNLDAESSLRIVDKYSRSNGVRYVDLLDVFRNVPPSSRSGIFYKTDSHLTAYGYSVAASAIARLIGDR